MNYKQSLLLRWSRRDRLAVLVVSLTVAFLIGSTLLTLAAGNQAATIAAEYGTSGIVERYDSVVAAKAAATPEAVVLPVATANRDSGQEVTVIGRTERAKQLQRRLGIELFDTTGRVTNGRLDESKSITLISPEERITVEARPRERTIFSPKWYVAPNGVVNRLGSTGALLIRPIQTSTPTQGIPLLSALAFFVIGTREVLTSLSIAVVGGWFLVSVTIYNVTQITVRDRLSSIKVIRATGARPRDILVIFGVRGTLLTAAGVAVGYATGIILPNTAINFAIFLGLPISLSLDVTWRAAKIIGLVAITTLSVGGIAGTFAARRVAQQPPARLIEKKSVRDKVQTLFGLRLLDWKTLVPTTATLTTFVIFVVLMVALAGAVAPLASTNGAIITEPGATHPIASDVPVGYATALRTRDIAASPEILAFAVRNGQPFVIRGVNATAFSRVTSTTIEEGRYPKTEGEALLGADLAQLLNIDIGDRLLLGGSTINAITEVRIVGTVTAPGVFDDQLLVSLVTARHLTGLAPGRVQFVRTTGLPARSSKSNASVGVIDMSVPDQVASNASFRVKVRLRNNGLTEQTRTIEIEFDGKERNRQVRVNPGSRRTIAVEFSTGRPGTRTLRIENRMYEIAVVPSDTIDIHGLPKKVPPGSEPLIQVRTLVDVPIKNATVIVENRTRSTGRDGTVRIRLMSPGRYFVTAQRGDQIARERVSVVPGVKRRVRVTLQIDPDTPGILTRPIARLRIQNPWNRTISRTVRIQTPGGTRSWNVTLEAGETGSMRVQLPRQPPGTYTVTSRIENEIRAKTTYEVTGDDRIVAAIAEGARGGQSGIGRAIKTAFGNLELVFSVIVGLAALMTVGGMTATFARAVHGRRQAIGIHRVTGAPRKRILKIVLKDALRLGIVATIGALVIGITVLQGFKMVGLLSPFGIQLSPVPHPVIVIGIALCTVSVALLSAALATVNLTRASPGSLLTDEWSDRYPSEWIEKSRGDGGE